MHSAMVGTLPNGRPTHMALRELARTKVELVNVTDGHFVQIT